MTIYSVGHSNHDPDMLAGYLAGRGITDLVDVRSKPYSRFNPGFNEQRFHRICETHGITYQWRGEQLGGFEKRTEEMALSLDRLISYYARRPRCSVVLMCSEGEPCDCHRHHWFGRYLALNSNEEMVHIHPSDDVPDIPAPQLGFDHNFNNDPTDGWPFDKPFRVKGDKAPPWVTRRGYATRDEARDYIKSACPALVGKLDISSVR